MQPLVMENKSGLVLPLPLLQPTIIFHNQGAHTNYLVHNKQTKQTIYKMNEKFFF